MSIAFSLLSGRKQQDTTRPYVNRNTDKYRTDDHSFISSVPQVVVCASGFAYNDVGEAD